MRATFVDPILIILATVLINALLFVMIPLLAETRQARHDYPEPIAAVTMQKPQDFEEEKQQQEPEEEIREEKLSKLPEETRMPEEQSRPPEPEMNLETPDFDVNADIDAGGGMAVAMPDGARDLGETVFRMKDLDEKPQLVNRVQPVYPSDARRKEINGKVILRFVVDRDGNVGNVRVIRADPEGIFEERAVEAVRKWRFKPGRYSGEAVRSRVTVPIRFEM
ncbi:MAG: energy transducer TonB [Thermodesulfobacteriota bacterium]